MTTRPHVNLRSGWWQIKFAWPNSFPRVTQGKVLHFMQVSIRPYGRPATRAIYCGHMTILATWSNKIIYLHSYPIHQTFPLALTRKHIRAVISYHTEKRVIRNDRVKCLRVSGKQQVYGLGTRLLQTALKKQLKREPTRGKVCNLIY